jgi:hypothetical protein
VQTYIDLGTIEESVRWKYTHHCCRIKLASVSHARKPLGVPPLSPSRASTLEAIEASSSQTMAVIWGLDLHEMQWSKFKSSNMFTRMYHLRRTKMIVYQCAMILCVVSESVGTAALSGWCSFLSGSGSNAAQKLMIGGVCSTQNTSTSNPSSSH